MHIIELWMQIDGSNFGEVQERLNSVACCHDSEFVDALGRKGAGFALSWRSQKLRSVVGDVRSYLSARYGLSKTH